MANRLVFTFEGWRIEAEERPRAPGAPAPANSAALELVGTAKPEAGGEVAITMRLVPDGTDYRLEWVKIGRREYGLFSLILYADHDELLRRFSPARIAGGTFEAEDADAQLLRHMAAILRGDETTLQAALSYQASKRAPAPPGPEPQHAPLPGPAAGYQGKFRCPALRTRCGH